MAKRLAGVANIAGSSIEPEDEPSTAINGACPAGAVGSGRAGAFSRFGLSIGAVLAARSGFGPTTRVTVKNLVVLKSDEARSLLILGGAVPGPRNAIVMVRKA